MEAERKKRLIIVFSANLLLSLIVGLAFFASKKPQAKTAVLPPKTATAGPTATAAPIPAIPELRQTRQASLRQEIQPLARSGSGRPDPMFVHEQIERGPVEPVVAAADKPAPVLVPPPPAISSLYETKLPAIPALPQSRELPRLAWKSNPVSKLDGVKLTAVIGNKAMLAVRRKNSERSEIICLAAGEETLTPGERPLTIVSVEPYRVVMEVDGDRMVRSLPEIR
ncbi:MAG: hypothetical protein K2X27_12905 [Candidatus Obscuribacterales bacterium]|nr:hypothetical protein [Candidatus Obscuribacterales bacterium]